MFFLKKREQDFRKIFRFTCFDLLSGFADIIIAYLKMHISFDDAVYRRPR